MQNPRKLFSLHGRLLTLSFLLLCTTQVLLSAQSFTSVNLFSLVPAAAGTNRPDRAQPLAAQKFPIRLERPPGLKEPHNASYRLVQKVNYKMLDDHPELSPAYKKGIETKFVLEIEGESRIEKTDESGRIREKSIRVKRWKPNDGLIAEGLQIDLQGKTLIIRENEGEKQFLVGGQPLKGFDRNILIALFGVDQIGEKGTDKAWGTTESQKIDDSWPITLDENFFKDLSKNTEVTINSEGKGTARLKGKMQASGRDCLSIELESKSQDWLSGEFADNVPIVDSSIQRNIQGNLPLDSRLPWQKIEDTQRFVITSKYSQGQLAGIRMRQTVQQQVQREITFPQNDQKTEPPRPPNKRGAQNLQPVSPAGNRPY